MTEIQPVLNQNFEQSHSAAKCKRGHFGVFFNIHPVAKYQKIEGGPFGDITKFQKKSHKSEKRCGKVSQCGEVGKGAPFWVLYSKLEVFGCVQNQVRSAFGKSAQCTKSGTYSMSYLV